MLDSGMQICGYCGAETRSQSPSFCANCESVVSTQRQALQKNDPERLAALDAINAGIASGEFESSAAAYEKLIAKYQEPGLSYASGILHIKWSNHILHGIDYSLPGYMEANSSTIDSSNTAASRSRAKFSYVINTYKLDTAHQDSISFAYTVFLCQIKLGNYQNAKRTAERISSMGNSQVSEYSAMVLASHTERYDDVLRYTDSLTENGKLYPNAAFYAALAMFNKRMDKEALELANGLREIIGAQRVDRLTGKISALGRISEGPISI